MFRERAPQRPGQFILHFLQLAIGHNVPGVRPGRLVAIQFHEAVGVTGIVLTKLDGTARGGIVVAIAIPLNSRFG